MFSGDGGNDPDGHQAGLKALLSIQQVPRDTPSLYFALGKEQNTSLRRFNFHLNEAVHSLAPPLK